MEDFLEGNYVFSQCRLMFVPRCLNSMPFEVKVFDDEISPVDSNRGIVAVQNQVDVAWVCDSATWQGVIVVDKAALDRGGLFIPACRQVVEDKRPQFAMRNPVPAMEVVAGQELP